MSQKSARKERHEDREEAAPRGLWRPPGWMIGLAITVVGVVIAQAGTRVYDERRDKQQVRAALLIAWENVNDTRDEVQQLVESESDSETIEILDVQPPREPDSIGELLQNDLFKAHASKFAVSRMMGERKNIQTSLRVISDKDMAPEMRLLILGKLSEQLESYAFAIELQLEYLDGKLDDWSVANSQTLHDLKYMEPEARSRLRATLGIPDSVGGPETK